EGQLTVRTAYRAIACLWSYEAANAYGPIDCLRSHDATIIHRIIRLLSELLAILESSMYSFYAKDDITDSHEGL
ncbi:hypothetical protein HAX54_010154, partial [Datura stramonium]|nr:hypothetical protein [Datura stramonium]